MVVGDAGTYCPMTRTCWEMDHCVRGGNSHSPHLHMPQTRDATLHSSIEYVVWNTHVFPGNSKSPGASGEFHGYRISVHVSIYLPYRSCFTWVCDFFSIFILFRKVFPW